MLDFAIISDLFVLWVLALDVVCCKFEPFSFSTKQAFKIMVRIGVNIMLFKDAKPTIGNSREF